MGIPYLTKHLLPYAETVLLGDGPDASTGPARVQSVVIDGPSLVYHVYNRLLALSEPAYDVLDIQPTCDEVSRGVMDCLLQLRKRNIEIHEICFDGALPVSKRETRLARIEKSRQQLELCRRRAVPPSVRGYRSKTPIKPGQLWRSRNLPPRWRNIPENPFMVSAVLEDLKERWSMDRIQEDQAGAHRLAGGDYPWGNITFLISGEADSECARVSKLTGAAVLTNDSDFLIHDLGSHGAVVLLNSVQLQESQQADEAEIRGLRLHPRHISRRLGIKNIQRFGFELKRNSHLSLPELLRQSMEHLGTTECSADYIGFLQEYQHREESSLTPVHRPYIQLLDPRVSELFWQYERPELYCGTEPPHLYLGILHEDHARRCAWEQGRSYRALGYALLNLSRPVTARFPVVHEFVRRGGRIIAEKVTLGGAKRVAADLVALKMRLDLARTIFDGDHRLSFWVFFALSEIYRDATNTTTRPSAVHLERFLQSGSMGQKTDWADIHLVAQIHAVLYSLRILKQFLGIARNRDLLDQNYAILASLPPLHRLIGSQYEMIRSFTDGNLAHSVHQFFKTYG